jgi:hypothetical protein
MRPVLATALGLLLWSGLALGAIASVDDAAHVLSPAQDQQLTTQLNQLGNHHFDVLFTSGQGDPYTLARQAFHTHHLGARDGVIVVDMASHKVGVDLGSAFAHRGVDGHAITRLIHDDFTPQAHSGDFSGGTLSLAQGLVDAGNTGGPVHPHHGFPWFWLIVIGLGAWFIYKRYAQGSSTGGSNWALKQGSQKRAGLAERLAFYKQQQQRLMDGALQLSDADDLARYQQGNTAEAYKQLGKQSADLTKRAAAFGGRVEEAEIAFKKGRKQDAETLANEIDLEAIPLESEIATAVTRFQALGDADKQGAKYLEEATTRLNGLKGGKLDTSRLQALETQLAQATGLYKGHDPDAAMTVVKEVHTGLDELEGKPTSISLASYRDALPDAPDALSRRLQEMKAIYENLQEKARGVQQGSMVTLKDPTVEGRLMEAYKALTTPPVDPRAAKARLSEAQQALDRYYTSVETALNTKLEHEHVSNQSMYGPGWGGGWSPGWGWGWGFAPPIIINEGGGWGSGFDQGGGWGGDSGGESGWGSNNDAGDSGGWGGFGGGDSGGGGDWGGGGGSDW